MELISKIRTANNLSVCDQMIASYVLENPTQVLTMDAKQLGDATLTSAASVVRFCKKVDTIGFTDFKIKLSAQINMLSANDIHIMKTTTFNESDTIDSAAAKLLQINTEAMKETRLLNTKDSVEQIVDLFDKAQCIDIYGQGYSFIIAKDIYYKLMRINKNCVINEANDIQIIQARNSNETHAALIISYSGKTEQSLRIAKELSLTGTKIITLTGTGSNELIRYSKHNLYVSSKESTIRISAVSSRTSMLYILDLIFTMLFIKNYEHNLEQCSKTMIKKG